MRKKQIEMLFSIYEKIESDNEIIEKTLEILNPGNYNFSWYWFSLLNNFLEIIKIEDEILYDHLEYLIFETWLWKNKLTWNKDYSVKVDQKTFILRNKEDCINFLLENGYIWM